MKFKLFFALILFAASIGWAVYEYNNPEGSYQTFFNNGVEMYNYKDYNSALEYFTIALSEKPEDGISCFYIGLCYVKMAEYETANYYFDLALKYEPELQERYDKAGLYKYKNKEYTDKTRKNENIVSNDTFNNNKNYDNLKSDNPQDYNDMGLEEFNNENYADAIIYFNKALTLDNKNLYAIYNKGLCYFFLEMYDEAIKEYSSAIKIDSQYKDAYFERGYVYFELKMYKEAINDFSKYIEIDPSEPAAYTNRGLAKYNLGNTKGACIDWELSKAFGGDVDTFINNYCK